MAKLFAKGGDPDQTPRFAASDLGQHCLPITLLRVSRLRWVKADSEDSGAYVFLWLAHNTSLLIRLGYLWAAASNLYTLHSCGSAIYGHVLNVRNSSGIR